MNLMDGIKDYIKDDKYKIVIMHNKLYVANYNEIKRIDNNIFSFTSKENQIIINGKNMTIKKLSKDEVLINGEFNNIEFR